MTRLKIFIMATLMIFAVSICGNSEAAIVRNQLPLQCYADKTITTYDVNTGKQVGRIDPQNDLIQILEIGSNGVARGTYPGQGGRRVERLFWARDVFADTNYSNRNVHVNGSHKVYRTQNSGATIGSIANEDVTVVADNGNRAQIIYRLNSGAGYKMGWVPSSIVATRGNLTVSTQNPMVEKVTRPTVNYAQPEPGDYYIVPLNSSCAIDVPNNSLNEGTVLQIYGQNNMPAQIFRLERVANGWYKIIHKDSGYVLNCQWGSNSNGTKLWLYHDDGTASCHWRFRDLGGGVYNIESELPSNPFLEVQNGNPFNGAVLQLWQQHTGNAAKWTLKKANTYVYPVEGYYSLTTLFYYENTKRALGHRHSVWWHKSVSEGGHFNALDIACKNGTPVKAVASGRVSSELSNDSSNIIVIEHNDTTVGKSLYAHLSEKLVSPGDTISAGQIIGKSGDKGASWIDENGVLHHAYHLHLEWFNSSPWEYYRDKERFQYHSSTERAFNKWCLTEDKKRFGDAITWIKKYGGGFK